MPKIPSKIPGSLARKATSGDLFVKSDIAYSYAIGGLPFLSAASRENPIVRETAPIRKQQFDNQTLPGEQSLDGWWLRSQQSFHGGAGQLFADPTQDNPFNSIRFRKSRNADVWTQGEVTLLDAVGKASNSTTTGNLEDMTEVNFGDGTGAAIGVKASSVVAITGVNTTTITTFTPTASALQSVTTDGTSIFVATLEGVYSSPIPASYPPSYTWTKQYNIAANTKPCFLAFVKHRIILTVGPAIYELAPYPAGPPVALPAAKYTSPDTNWVWSGITESASAIYVVGNNTVRGSILKFVLATDGSIPTLTGGAIAAQLPSGEVPYSAIGYLGAFVALGTNKGVRVGVSDTNGNLEYGPLLFDSTKPVRAWTARDRFLWCTVSQGIDGATGLYRIDLSLQLADLRFPYATDLVAQPDDGVILSAEDASDCLVVANVGSTNLIAFGTVNDSYVQNSAIVAKTGYLQTSRIRYNTLEPKIYKLLRVRGPVLEGPLAYVTLDQNDNESSIRLFPEGQSPGDTDATIDQPSEPVDFMSLKFVMSRDDVNVLKGGAFWAYQLKALPASPRQRLIQLPLWCFDFEKDRHGNRRGGLGTAQRRLRALEELEKAGDSVILQDFDVATSDPVVIERVSYRQTAPPPHFEGWGGIVTVTVRTIQ